MNAEQIRKMEAGREMDALVAEKVMERDPLNARHGLKNYATGEYELAYYWGYPVGHMFAPFYSTSNGAVQHVIDAMRESDFWWSASYKTACFVDDLNRPGYEVTFRCVYGGTRGTHVGVADTLAHATSIAALLAVMGEEE